MSGRYVLAADLGSGSCKTVVMDEQGRVAGDECSEYRTFYERPGWVEQDPEDWYRAFCKTTRKAIQRSNIDPSEIVMVGIVGVTHNTVLLDEKDRPLRRAILTFDGRSAEQCRTLCERWGERITGETQNRMGALWSWPQLLWIRENEPDVWRRMRLLLFQKDYVRHRLAPALVTDTIEAIGSLLYNPQSGAWVEDFISDLGVEVRQLPSLRKPMEIVSEVSGEGAKESGLAAGTPVITGTTDTAAEIFGSGLLYPGQGMVKLASVGRLAVVSSVPVPGLINYRHVNDGLWYPGSGTKSAATVGRWIRDNLWSSLSFEQMDMEAEKVPAGSEGLLFQPHLIGEWAPYYDDRLRANYIGVTIRHTRAHFIRAALEGVAFSLRNAIEHMAELGLPYREYRLIGGGARSRLWGQTISDVLKSEIIIPLEQDAVYGAALVTAIASGFFDCSQVEDLVAVDRIVRPGRENSGRYEELYGLYLETETRLADISRLLTEYEERHCKC